MAVPAVVLLLVEAIRVDGGCNHDAQACRRGGNRRRDSERGPGSERSVAE